MCCKEFSEHTGIPVRTLEDWEAARRTPPEYIPRLNIPITVSEADIDDYICITDMAAAKIQSGF